MWLKLIQTAFLVILKLMDHLSKLVGKIITNISKNQEPYYPLSDKEKIHTNNEVFIEIEDYSISIFNKIVLDADNEDISFFKGKKIKAILQLKDEVRISTTDNRWFSIDLRNEAYVGPEAISLHGPDNLIVIW
jgi:hypothetical protein